VFSVGFRALNIDPGAAFCSDAYLGGGFASSRKSSAVVTSRIGIGADFVPDASLSSDSSIELRQGFRPSCS
jgi:hypothetical protein